MGSSSPGQWAPMAQCGVWKQANGPMQTLLVTGGAGFIGANFVLQAVADGFRVVNLDKLTYAGNLDTLASLEASDRHLFVQGDIGDRALVAQLLAEHRPRAIEIGRASCRERV